MTGFYRRLMTDTRLVPYVGRESDYGAAQVSVDGVAVYNEGSK